MLENAEVDGKTYKINYTWKNGEVTFRYLDENNEWYKLSARYTPELLEVLRFLDAEEDMLDFLLIEIKLDISKRNNGKFYKEYTGKET